MDVYLMQHGAAVAEDVDPLRPLSEAGVRSVAEVAGHAASCGVRIDRVVHSDKVRAEQSAHILADSLYCTDVSAHSGLHPKDPAEAAAAKLVHPGSVSSIGIVGHLPFLDRLASLLVAGDPDVGVVTFHNAGLVRLVPRAPAAGPADALRGGYAVGWALVPELTEVGS